VFKIAAPPLFGLAATTATEMIIAIDGPAASGKGTLGKRLAAHFGLRHLDTGLLYRAVAKALIDAGHSLEDRAKALAAAQALDPARLDERTLKTHAIGEAASIVSAYPEVRAALVELQRDFARKPPGAVLDGRDEASILADIERRDERDRTRAVAPLKAAADAHLLDTTHLDIDAAVRAAIAIVKAARAE
jgi:cytidylate kinase